MCICSYYSDSLQFFLVPHFPLHSTSSFFTLYQWHVTATHAHITQCNMQASHHTVLTLFVSGPALTSPSPDLPRHLGISWPNCPCQNWMLLVSSPTRSPSALVSPVTQPALPDYIQQQYRGSEHGYRNGCIRYRWTGRTHVLSSSSLSPLTTSSCFFCALACSAWL